MTNIVLFEPPGSGKGTQSIKLAEKYKLAHISTGDIFRKNIAEQTPLGIKVKEVISRGELVSDDLLVAILEDAIDDHKNVDGFIFDGFPRTIQQANDLTKILAARNSKVSAVIALQVNHDEIIKRLLNRAKLEGRKDDTQEVIENRLNVYKNQTKPLCDFYRDKNLLSRVEGIGSIDDIFDSLCTVIDQNVINPVIKYT